MINILSYVGMNLQSEVCLWALLGLMRTIFDATLFKVNANLKQVWQMTMPEELTMPVQRVLRTMISGVMLVQCFTVYVYLASYIVLLYPVFLEERPTLVLPWLLLAAIRKLLCELTSLALGLGTCVLLGPARTPCIKFLLLKCSSIMPAFYMWMLVFSYYHTLKVASAFKTFPAVLPPNDLDYGLELAVRRRRTKSLFGEEQLRKKLVANFYRDSNASITNQTFIRPNMQTSSVIINSEETSNEEVAETDGLKTLTLSTTGWSECGAYEDWFGNEVIIPRDTDRILEQIVLMLLRIGAYLKKEGLEAIMDSQILNTVPPLRLQRENIDCSATMNADETDTPPLVGSSKGNMAAYLREYPQIFMKKQGADITPNDLTIASLKTVQSHVDNDNLYGSKVRKLVSPDTNTSSETLSSQLVPVGSKKNINTTENKNTKEEEVMTAQPRQVTIKETVTIKIKNIEVKRRKSKRKKSETEENKSSKNVDKNMESIDVGSSRVLFENNSEETSNNSENEEGQKLTELPSTSKSDKKEGD